MSTANDPRPLTRKELAQFLPSDRAIRAFEKLFDITPESLNEVNNYLNEIKHQPINVITDYEVSNGNFLILVDASAAPVTITLPDVQNAYSTYNTDYFVIGITKIDTGSNAVTIACQSGQTILNEATQSLLVDGEVINVTPQPASDNWELAS